MTYVELCSIIIIFISTIYSFKRNPASNLFTSLKILVSLISGAFSQVIIKNFPSDLTNFSITQNKAVLFICFFIVFYLTITISGFIIKQVITISIIPLLTKPIGLISGIINGCLLTLVFLILIHLSSLKTEKIINQNSIIYKTSSSYLKLFFDKGINTEKIINFIKK